MNLLERIDRLNEIGIALSAENDTQKLLELIMMGAKSLTNADGGTLYFVKEDLLSFEIISNDSLNIRMGGTSGKEISFKPLPLYVDGQPNHSMVVSHCVHQVQTINIADAYDAEGFDFSGARKFDENTGYRTQSLLTFPLKDHEDEVIGVLQLINAQDRDSGKVIAFSDVDQQLAESLASQAAVALTQKRLVAELRNLFEAFIRMIASAIDDKSPYTGGHCRRIPVLTMMLAEATDKAAVGPMSDFKLDAKDRYELETAAWLHDCGKVVTPEYVMDKATKLETIFDRIELVKARFEIMSRDLEIAFLRHQLQQNGIEIPSFPQDLQEQLEGLKADLAFLEKSNVGGEFMTEEDQQRVRALGELKWRYAGQEQPLLSQDEIYNLCIQRGTLTSEEREVINHHIVATIKMLESLPFPKHLKNVPEYAGGHHEKMDGSGYPRGLTRDQMSVQARIMAIADIFEALSARDRPYKKGKTLSECLRIMGFMKKDHHIDPDLFDIFVREKVYLHYAEEFLTPDQIDEVDESKIPGYAVL